MQHFFPIQIMSSDILLTNAFYFSFFHQRLEYLYNKVFRGLIRYFCKLGRFSKGKINDLILHSETEKGLFMDWIRKHIFLKIEFLPRNLLIISLCWLSQGMTSTKLRWMLLHYLCGSSIIVISVVSALCVNG